MPDSSPLFLALLLSGLVALCVGAWIFFVYEPAQEQYRLADEARSKRDPRLCEKIDEPMARDLCLRDVGSSTQEPAICERIITQSIGGECLRNIAVSKWDPAVCDIIEDDAQMRGCIGSFGIEYACYRTNDTGTRDMCYAKAALENTKPGLCEKIRNNSMSDQCYRKLGTTLKQKELCLKIGDPAQRNICIREMEQASARSYTPPICRETDSYWVADEYLAGNISGEINGYAYQYPDACINNLTLSEWDCVRGIPTAKHIKCPLGCLSGRCLRYTCIDYHKEGGYNDPSNLTLFHPNGSVSFVYLDECVGKNHDILDVARCDPGDMSGMKWEKINCIRGCVNTIGYHYGRCL
ncbi:MAG: hypothetical protein V1875_09290 [Candidatus Altiarchaeota archaeon]